MTPTIYVDDSLYEITDADGLRSAWVKTPYVLAGVVLETETYISFIEREGQCMSPALKAGRKLLLQWCKASLPKEEYILLLMMMEQIR